MASRWSTDPRGGRTVCAVNEMIGALIVKTNSNALDRVDEPLRHCVGVVGYIARGNVRLRIVDEESKKSKDE